MSLLYCLGSHDRSIRVWLRSREMLNVEEEMELEREAEYEQEQVSLSIHSRLGVS